MSDIRNKIKDFKEKKNSEKNVNRANELDIEINKDLLNKYKRSPTAEDRQTSSGKIKTETQNKIESSKNTKMTRITSYNDKTVSDNFSPKEREKKISFDNLNLASHSNKNLKSFLNIENVFKEKREVSEDK